MSDHRKSLKYNRRSQSIIQSNLPHRWKSRQDTVRAFGDMGYLDQLKIP